VFGQVGWEGGYSGAVPMFVSPAAESSCQMSRVPEHRRRADARRHAAAGHVTGKAGDLWPATALISRCDDFHSAAVKSFISAMIPCPYHGPDVRWPIASRRSRMRGM
jgi:hypothetical protein